MSEQQETPTAPTTPIKTETVKPESQLDDMTQYLTGYALSESPNLVAATIARDHRVVKVKYGLPPRDMKVQNQAEFLAQLEAIAKKNNTELRRGIEFQQFFEKHFASGFHENQEAINNTIVRKSKDLADEKERWDYMTTTEHELIHALQSIRYPEMPIEIQEYEAYISADINPQKLIKEPELIEYVMGFINFSVHHYYQEQEVDRPTYRQLLEQQTEEQAA